MKPGEANKLTIHETLKTLFGPESVETEYRFHPVRRWRFDYAVPEIRLAVEYNGHAGFIGRSGASGHSSIAGITRDAEKLNAAIGHGWRVLQFTALHFRMQDRHKHNLRDVRSTIMDVLGAMQDEGDILAERCCNQIKTEMKQALEAADECLALIEDVGHGAHMDNVTVARGIIAKVLSSANNDEMACPKCGATRTYYDGWNCPTEGCDAIQHNAQDDSQSPAKNL